MPGLFNNQSIEIPCPECNKKHSKKVAWLKSHRQITCSCGNNIAIDAHKLLKTLKDLEKKLTGLSRKITIKL